MTQTHNQINCTPVTVTHTHTRSDPNILNIRVTEWPMALSSQLSEVTKFAIEKRSIKPAKGLREKAMQMNGMFAPVPYSVIHFNLQNEEQHVSPVTSARTILCTQLDAVNYFFSAVSLTHSWPLSGSVVAKAEAAIA